MFYWLLRFMLGPILKVVWVNDVEGLENIPETGPVIIAANHTSYFDFLSMVAIVKRRIYFLAAEKFYNSKFWAPIMLLTGQVKVDRSNNNKERVISQANNILSKNDVLGIFPEGTRSRSGKLQRAYTGVAKFAIENKCDIIPLAIEGAFEIMSPHDKVPKFDKKCNLYFLNRIRYEDIKNMSPEKITHEILMPRIAEKLGEKYIAV